ncbi:MAG: MFS transporter, partial [Desulfobacteraceae bacterium]
EKYAPERRGMATGFYIASSSLGYFVSLVLSGIAIPLGGYRLSFLLTAGATILSSIVLWVTLAKTQETLVVRQKKQSFKGAVLANKPAMLFMGAYTAHCWELLGMWAWAPAFMTACLMSDGSEGLYAAGVGAYITAGFIWPVSSPPSRWGPCPTGWAVLGSFCLWQASARCAPLFSDGQLGCHSP